jgi:hypothetical protein
MRDAEDRFGLGAMIGLGVAAGAVVLFVRFSRTAPAVARSPREPLPPTVVPTAVPTAVPTEVPRGAQGRFPALVERWRGEVTRRSKDLPVPALLEWILIESGGDMCSIGAPSEVGIFQLMFPGDAKYGASLEGLRAICRKSKQQDPSNLSWLSEGELDMEVGAGIRKILAGRDEVRRAIAQNRIAWPETSFDFGSVVKQIHAAPAVITELLPKLSHQGGAPASWNEMRRRALAFPIDQLGKGLRSLALAPSRHGLRNRLEDTLNNAEGVGRAWEASYV